MGSTVSDDEPEGKPNPSAEVKKEGLEGSDSLTGGLAMGSGRSLDKSAGGGIGEKARLLVPGERIPLLGGCVDGSFRDTSARASTVVGVAGGCSSPGESSNRCVEGDRDAALGTFRSGVKSGVKLIALVDAEMDRNESEGDDFAFGVVPGFSHIAAAALTRLGLLLGTSTAYRGETGMSAKSSTVSPTDSPFGGGTRGDAEEDIVVNRVEVLSDGGSSYSSTTWQDSSTLPRTPYPAHHF